MGLSSVRERSRASGPHGYQSTGLCACWSRYGLVSSINLFVCCSLAIDLPLAYSDHLNRTIPVTFPSTLLFSCGHTRCWGNWEPSPRTFRNIAELLLSFPFSCKRRQGWHKLPRAADRSRWLCEARQATLRTCQTCKV